MRLAMMWLGLAFALLICVLALGGGVWVGSICEPARIQRLLRAKDMVGFLGVLISLFSLFSLGIGAIILGMRCLLGRIEMPKSCAIAVGLPCTTFGLFVLLLAAYLSFCRLIMFGGPG